MMLMLIDSYEPPREPDPEPRSWRLAGLRPWLPVLGAVLCLIAASFVPPLVSYVLTVSGLVLFARAAISLLPVGDGLSQHRQ